MLRSHGRGEMQVRMRGFRLIGLVEKIRLLCSALQLNLGIIPSPCPWNGRPASAQGPRGHGKCTAYSAHFSGPAQPGQQPRTTLFYGDSAPMPILEPLMEVYWALA